MSGQNTINLNIYIELPHRNIKYTFTLFKHIVFDFNIIILRNVQTHVLLFILFVKIISIVLINIIYYNCLFIY